MLSERILDGVPDELLYNAEANRLTQVRDINPPNTIRHTYAYDEAGFVTDRDGVTLGYDATGAIASIGSVAAFDHDLDGRPVSRTLYGVTKHFRFGGAIAYTPSGTPLEMDLGEVVLKLDGPGPNRFRHLDFRGNVLFVSKSNGSVEGFAMYRGFGTHWVSGQLGERGFAGGFEIPSLGLVVLGPRVLDSDTGRFLSQDPVFNAVNQYAYAQGNPVMFWDPTGRFFSGLGSFGSFTGFIGFEGNGGVSSLQAQALARQAQLGWGVQFGISGVGGVVGFDLSQSYDLRNGRELLTFSGLGDVVGFEADMDVSLFAIRGGLPALLNAEILDVNLEFQLSVKFFFDSSSGTVIGGALGIGPGVGSSVVLRSDAIGNLRRWKCDELDGAPSTSCCCSLGYSAGPGCFTCPLRSAPTSLCCSLRS